MVRGVGIQSRFGNFVLVVIGATYVAAALSLFIYYVASAWNGASLLDRILQLGLLISLAASAWFVAIALHNLGVHWHRPRHS